MLDALQKMQMFEETVEEDFHRLTDLEDVSRWQPIQQIPTKHLQREVDQTKVINTREPCCHKEAARCYNHFDVLVRCIGTVACRQMHTNYFMNFAKF